VKRLIFGCERQKSEFFMYPQWGTEHAWVPLPVAGGVCDGQIRASEGLVYGTPLWEALGFGLVNAESRPLEDPWDHPPILAKRHLRRVMDEEGERADGEAQEV
jgi:hypothetical protein